MTYNPLFLSKKYSIKLPSLSKDNQKLLKANTLLDYTHFSIFYSIDRKAPICTAVNIDGSSYVHIKRGSDVWQEDPNVGGSQINDDFYKNSNSAFHRGHIVRRLDPCWGKEAEAKQGESDTFYYSNASPQHKKFNPKIWLELERAVLEKGAVHNEQKITVFAGPIIHKLDKPFIKPINEELIFIPSHYWKIILWKKGDGKVHAVGFIQSQKGFIDKLVDQNFGEEKKRDTNDDYFENLEFNNDAVYQVNISYIEKIGGLDFGFSKLGIIMPLIENDIRELETKEEFEDSSIKNRFRTMNNDDKKIQIIGMVL